MLIVNLVKKVLNGPDRHVEDKRSGLKIVKMRDHLLVYRYGELKIWLDLELRYLVKWSLNTQAEVTAFNRILEDAGINDYYKFVRTGRMVLVQAGENFYNSGEYNEKFGPESGNYGNEGPGDPP